MPTIPINFFSSAGIFITGTMKSPAAVGSAYSSPALTLSGATGGGTWGLDSAAPSWLTINLSTGVFGGTPTVYLPGITGTVKAAASGYPYYSPALTLHDASGGGTWAIGAGAPSWLTINASTGVFGGTPP